MDSLNDVLMGRRSNEPSGTPFRTPGVPTPVVRKGTCSLCAKDAVLEPTPVGARCATCAQAHYRLALAHTAGTVGRAPTARIVGSWLWFAVVLIGAIVRFSLRH